MTDMVWLNMFRIISARMSRNKHMFAFLIYVPLDGGKVIDEIISGFARIAEGQGLDHDYGFLTPMDFGKRAILEYDYYIDHTDEAEKARDRPGHGRNRPLAGGLVRKAQGGAVPEVRFLPGMLA